MGNKKVYEKPNIIDLNSSSASGQQYIEQGQCRGGGSLTYETCGNGDTPMGGSCAPNGVIPEEGYCRTGGLAVEGCRSGGSHT